MKVYIYQNPEVFIKDQIGEAALYEQLAEEASELAQAALKAARILRDENPTPIEPEEAYNNLIEEYTDVCLVAEVLELQTDDQRFATKLRRWVNRILGR